MSRVAVDTELLKGHSHTYAITSRRPFAYGRVSVLYEAKAPTGDIVAAKLFKQEPRDANDQPAFDEFFRELDAQGHLKHPNILPVVDYGASESGQQPFVVYQFCRGGNLRDFMRERQYVPLNDALPILHQIAAAIDYAHSRGFIHGDVKPENVLFRDVSHVYLSDFGMARHFAFTARVSTVTGGEIGGTTAYLSPEELAQGKQSTRSDLYSFGLVAFELLTGRLPFELNAPLYQQIKCKVEGSLLNPADANPGLARGVVAALQNVLNADPHRRPASATAFCALLASDTPITVAMKTAETASERRGTWASLDSTAKAGIIGAAIAAAAGIIAALINILPDLFK
jgi:serine/threonine protein kinase